MSTEIELKLAIAPADVAAFRRLPALRDNCVDGPTRRKVLNLYFDTPGLSLRANAMALRLRKSGNSWLQTLKTAGSTAGGLHQRGEWEYPLSVPQLDLALFRKTPLAKLRQARDLHLMLKPVFTTDFTRTTWQIEIARGQRVEIALDQGVIRCGERTAIISEVEIELLEGSAATVFEVAQTLASRVTLRPDNLSKAERGYLLFRPEGRMPARAAPVELKRNWPGHQALRTIIGGCLDQLGANVAGALETDDPEYIHQARVSLRRLRSALRIFRPAHMESIAADLKWLTAALSEARDWDVFMTETLPALLKDFGDGRIAKSLVKSGTARRVAARETARVALASRRSALLVLSVSRAAAIERELAFEGVLANDPSQLSTQKNWPSLRRFAAHEIRRRHRRLLRVEGALVGLPAEARHRIRIDTKRLRYAVDFFSSLFAEGRVSRYASILGEIQDLLGEANDTDVAMRLMGKLAPPRRFAQFTQGWAAARIQKNLAEIDQRFAALRIARHFWKS